MPDGDQQMSFHVPSQLHTKFKAITVRQGRSMREVLCRYIQGYVNDNKHLLGETENDAATE